MNNDSASEIRSIAIRITGTGAMISAMPPGRKINGANAATDVNTANVNGTLIRLAPRMAATTPGAPWPRSRCVKPPSGMAFRLN